MSSRSRVAREQKTVSAMIRIYCRGKHGTERGLCRECSSLQGYAWNRLQKCPFQEGKTTCAKCPVHCYKPEYRKRIKEVMRFSGMYFVSRGRLDWLVRYFLN